MIGGGKDSGWTCRVADAAQLTSRHSHFHSVPARPDAIADRRVTPDETQALRAKWNGLRKRAETFVRRCEKGDYGADK